MPSPFPGMDPYLEGEMWQEFHATLSNAIRSQLLAVLPPQYTALLAKRYVLDRYPRFGATPQPQAIYPDVHVARLRESAPAYVAAAPVRAISPYIEEVPQLSVEVRDVAERRLVTLIEILSPINKIGQGAGDYGRRRRLLLKRDIHLLELDLLRGGKRIQLWGEVPPAAYYIYLSRLEDRPVTQVWPIALQQPLPTVPVPLLEPDPDVTLDVQAAVNACYDLVHYERLLDYAGPPPPPELTAEELAWIDATLRAAGLRPGAKTS
ncbi:MAG: DUF4058 family protein [Anaerolineae bacterium]